jgi:putative Mg2+ transporter-C (MgtC) family protein
MQVKYNAHNRIVQTRSKKGSALMNPTEPILMDILRVCAAMLAGGLIGLEREYRDKSAGFRTLIFIGAGAALITILSRQIGGEDDPSRITANIVTGIGFLGAGAILRDGMRLSGLTTAATIWLTAAIGIAFGAGEYLFGAGITLLALLVLWVFPAFEIAVDRIREEHSYDVSVLGGRERATEIDAILGKMGMKVTVRQCFKEGDGLRCRWVAFGKPESHERFVQYLLDEPSVREFKY